MIPSGPIANGADIAGDHPCFGCPVRHRALCSALRHEELARFRRTGIGRRLAESDALCREGTPAAHVYTVKKGALRLSKLLRDGRRQVIGFAFPGDFVGVTMEGEHPFTIEATCDAEVCQFLRIRFVAFLADHPHLDRRLFGVAARDLAVAREQILVLGRKTAIERLATFLLDMTRHSTQIPGEPARAVLPMPRSDIADYLGVRNETISRELGVLKSKRLIRMIGTHKLAIIDRAAMERLAAGDDALTTWPDPYPCWPDPTRSPPASLQVVKADAAPEN
ncbi:helix-turn-helix domain-containing protein [Sphingopyxis sp. XHP0097]|uniref:Helix-turn-helix domain-containing protein n=2 Tax=Sphingopyxis jiangsuensis TaxID=2871171 RepID=A0ABS7MBT5_9SPHN|nr:helix-turn-helix domain-containing protein [Sphingopyxis sp. P8]MBY4636491.1 helix-turn-helix domain-containing protein [Sphingopyxis jiangsuensis]